jgi:hypothetical protein
MIVRNSGNGRSTYTMPGSIARAARRNPLERFPPAVTIRGAAHARHCEHGRGQRVQSCFPKTAAVATDPFHNTGAVALWRAVTRRQIADEALQYHRLCCKAADARR